jgi:long-subunit fatty acid transport protein
VADPWLLSAGIAYDSSMVDDKDRTPDLPTGESWRFGLGARYDWSAAPRPSKIVFARNLFSILD